MDPCWAQVTQAIVSGQGDEDDAVEAISMFQEFAECPSPLLDKALSQILMWALQLGSMQQQPFVVRRAAIRVSASLLLYRTNPANKSRPVAQHSSLMLRHASSVWHCQWDACHSWRMSEMSIVWEQNVPASRDLGCPCPFVFAVPYGSHSKASPPTAAATTYIFSCGKSSPL